MPTEFWVRKEEEGFGHIERKERREETDMNDITALCDTVRQTAYDIHVYHGHGHLETVYESALAHRLAKAGLEASYEPNLGFGKAKVFIGGEPSLTLQYLGGAGTGGAAHAEYRAGTEPDGAVLPAGVGQSGTHPRSVGLAGGAGGGARVDAVPGGRGADDKDRDRLASGRIAAAAWSCRRDDDTPRGVVWPFPRRSAPQPAP